MSSESRPYYQETWFILLFFGACFGLGYLLFHYLMPTPNLSSHYALSMVAMAKLFAGGRLAEAIGRFNLPPVYAVLVSIAIRLGHSDSLPHLIHGIHQLNLMLYFASIILVHQFVRRHIHAPYSLIVTALYTIAPSTLAMVWDIGPYIAYVVFSFGALYAIDYCLSQESAMAGEITRWELILCATLLGLTILCHQIGYALVLAFAIVMVKRFGFKHSLTLIAMMIVILSPLIGRDLYHVVRHPKEYTRSTELMIQETRHRNPVKTVQFYADRVFTSIGNHTIGGFNLKVLDKLTEEKSFATNRAVQLTRNTWARWAIGILALVGAAFGFRQYTGVGPLYLTAYTIGALVLLPQFSLSLGPVVPLFLLYLYFGIYKTGEWLMRLNLPFEKYVAPTLTAWITLCALSTLFSARGDIQAHLFTEGFQPPELQAMAEPISDKPQILTMNTSQNPDSRLETAQRDAAHRRVMDWLHAHTLTDAQVATPNPQAKAILTTFSGDSSAKKQIQSELRHYDYLVEEDTDTISGKSSSMLRHHSKSTLQPDSLGTDNGSLHMVYEDIPGHTRVWKISRSQ